MTPPHYLLRRRDDGSSDRRVIDQLGALTPGVREALGLLDGNGISEARMTEIARAADGDTGVASLFFVLTRLQQAGQLEYGLRLSDGSEVRVIAQRPGPVLLSVPFDAVTTYRLSRDAFMRPDHGTMQIESALRPAVLRFDSWLPGAVIAHLGRPASCDSIVAALPASAADVSAVMELLVLAGFAEAIDARDPAALGLWDFHELLFHVRSSTPRLGEPFGGMDPHRQPERPPLKTAFQDAEAIALPAPRLEQWVTDDPPFARVIESRRSAAMPGSTRPTLTQVADFLYRTAHLHTGMRRALPSAGARHELEFYVAVHDAGGLAAGFYHYAAASHALHKLNAPDDLVGDLLSRAAASWSTRQHYPHLLIVVASRFPRMASRYASIAYRNTLLDAGIAIEAMYLNATAMGLAPCALGINLPDLFSRITGLDPLEEAAVAMFALSA
jgi:SagB-type dehydrogenase family enzyme